MPTPRDTRNTTRELRRMTPIKTLPTNEDILSEYLTFQTSRHVRRPWRAATVSVRTSQLRIFAAAIAPITLLAATEDVILDWHAKIKGSPETLGSYASAVRGLYQWIVARARLRSDDPTLLLERPLIPEALPRPMLDRHFGIALACAVSDPEMYIWLGLMGCSGLRCCEIAWMNIGDVEELEGGGGLLHITGKRGKQRTVPAGEMLMLTMRPFLKGRGPVFTRPSDDGAHTPHAVSSRTNSFLEGVGVPKPWTAHTLRHRFGTDYHALDVDLYRQAKIMGHSSVDTTRRYTEVSPVEAAAYIETLTRRRLIRPGQRTVAAPRRDEAA